EGEALLGWLNCTVSLAARKPFDADKLLKILAGEVQWRLGQQQAEIAHLKMTLSPDGGLGEIAAVNLVRNDFVPEHSMELEEPVRGGQLIINLRAEAAPELLGTVVADSVLATATAFPGMTAVIEHLEKFRPGKP